MMDHSTTPEEAIRMAIEREKGSYEFYTQAAKIAIYPGTRQMFEYLAKEELRHRKMLEEELNRNYSPDM